jgi:hypothetical protein
VDALVKVWKWLCDYFGVKRRGRRLPIKDISSLCYFIETRASHVAQTSLYGYVRTRAGVRYPELFHNDSFAEALDIAKWQVWLACLADLAVYAGGLLAHRTSAPDDRVGALMAAVVSQALDATGIPADAGPAFAAGAGRIRERLAGTDWSAVTDDDDPFCESPEALVVWAPIVDELKQYDTEIVRNSVRFRWQQVRRDLRRDLDAAAVMRSDIGDGRGGVRPAGTPSDGLNDGSSRAM